LDLRDEAGPKRDAAPWYGGKEESWGKEGEKGEESPGPKSVEPLAALTAPGRRGAAPVLLA